MTTYIHMPRRRIQLSDNEIYHIVTRGIDERLIFLKKADYHRAVCNLFEFNDVNPVHWRYRHYNAPHRETRPREVVFDDREREKLVEILSFCLMPNHIHLLLRQLCEGGISSFMKKLNGGYATYFNKKYERTGYLFESRFKAVHIKTDRQLRIVFVYIHTNPVALIDFKWKKGGIKDTKKVIEFIENYKWSSYLDYLGKENFPSVTQRDLFDKMMSRDRWRKFVSDWVEFKGLDGFGDVSLE